MKMMIIAPAIGALLSFTVAAQPPTPAPRPAKPNSAPADSPSSGGTGAEGKIAYVNASKFNDGILELKVKLEALNTELDPKKKEFQAAEDELNKLKSKIQTQGGTVSPQVRNQWVEEATEKEKNLKRKGEDYEAFAQKRLAEVSQPVYDKIQKFLSTYCPQRGIALLFEGGIAYQSGGLIWNVPEADITDDFIKEYNKANPVAAVPSGGARKD